MNQKHQFGQVTDEILEFEQVQLELRDVSADEKISEPFVVNLGPQHPSTHGVFRCRLLVDGESVLEAENKMGYLHRGIEKLAETRTYAQFTPYADRLDYLSPILNEWGYLMAVEKLAGIEVPERGEYIRVIFGELQRIANHLLYGASLALDMNGYTVWMYMMREREKILDIFESYCGKRMNNHALRIGGAPYPLPAGLDARIHHWLDEFPIAMKDFANVFNGNEIMQARTVRVGIIDKDACLDYGVFGVNMRAAGVPQDLRKDKPYSVYDRFEFDIPTGIRGDSFDRYMVRYHEMEESAKIVRQALNQMPGDGPTLGKVPRVLKVPAGRAYTQIEGSKGWLGFYIVADGTNKPSRIRIHAPCVSSLFALENNVDGMLLQDYIAGLASIDIVLGEVDR